MKAPILAILCTTALLAGSAVPSYAAVNCGMVKKDLDQGKKLEDIAERLGITVSEVKKCKDQSGTPAGSTGPSSAAPKPATPPPASGQDQQ